MLQHERKDEYSGDSLEHSKALEDAADWLTHEHSGPRRSLAEIDAEMQWPYNNSAVRQLVERIYDNVDGFKLSAHDRAIPATDNATFRPTYGEFFPDGVSVLLDALNVSIDDVFLTWALAQERW